MKTGPLTRRAVLWQTAFVTAFVLAIVVPGVIWTGMPVWAALAVAGSCYGGLFLAIRLEWME